MKARGVEIILTDSLGPNDQVSSTQGWTGPNVISTLFEVEGPWVVGEGLGVTQGGCLTPDEKKIKKK